MFSGARKPTSMKKKLHTGKPKIPFKALFIARQFLHDMILSLEFGISLLYLLLLLLPRPPSPTITLALTPSSIPQNNSFPTENPKKTAALNITKAVVFGSILLRIQRTQFACNYELRRSQKNNNNKKHKASEEGENCPHR